MKIDDRKQGKKSTYLYPKTFRPYSMFMTVVWIRGSGSRSTMDRLEPDWLHLTLTKHECRLGDQTSKPNYFTFWQNAGVLYSVYIFLSLTAFSTMKKTVFSDGLYIESFREKHYIRFFWFVQLQASRSLLSCSNIDHDPFHLIVGTSNCIHLIRVPQFDVCQTCQPKRSRSIF